MDFAYLPEFSVVAENDTHLALGFTPPSDIDLDGMLPTTGTSYKGSFGKVLKSGLGGVKVFTTRDTSIVTDIMNVNVIDEMMAYHHVLGDMDGTSKMIVKVTPVSTWRDLLTCFKEAMMTKRIYSTEKNGVSGSDCVCKPYACTPVKLGEKWHYVFVTELAKGKCVKVLQNFITRKVLKISKKEMMVKLSEACDMLWSLGFAHNDLHPGNIIYNPETKSAKFIDLETAIEVTPDVLDKYVQSRSTSSDDCYVTFQNVMLAPAMNMLRHSEGWVNEFSTNENGSKVLYNTDCYFLWAMS